MPMIKKMTLNKFVHDLSFYKYTRYKIKFANFQGSPKCYYKGMSLEQNENFLCPYCGETNELLVDVSGGPHQEFVVDCEVCCAPIVVRLQIRGR